MVKSKPWKTLSKWLPGLASGNGPFDTFKTSSYHFAGTDDVPRDLTLSPTEDKTYTFEGDLRDADMYANDGTPIDSKSRPSVTFSGDVYSNPWDAERQPGEQRWTDSFLGRAATRVFSRGVMGATFMALGNSALRTYNPHMPYENMHWVHKRLKNIATGFDFTLGKPIKAVFGEDAVNFRMARAFFNATPSKKIAALVDSGELKLEHVEEALNSVNFDFKRFNLHNEAGGVDYTKLANFVKTDVHRVQRAEINLLASKMKYSEKFASALKDPAVLPAQKREAFDALLTPNSKHLFSTDYLDDLFKHTRLAGSGPEQAPRMLLSMINGRGLGDEMVGVTLDFAMGSFGDAIGRALMQTADPNYKKQWIEDGHINYGKLASGIGSTLWQAVSYNQMEDWFTALPYVYYMKTQRNLLDRVKPGFKLVSDNQLAASERYDVNGTLMPSYMREGALDLQGRFMHYNFWTLLYRDLYNHGRHKIQEWKENGVHPDMPTVGGIVDGTGEAVKYVAKSFIKSQMYMLPSVPFFWMWRVPQNKPDSVVMVTGEEKPNAQNSRYSPMTFQQTLKPFKDADKRKYYDVVDAARDPHAKLPENYKTMFTSLSPGWIRLTDLNTDSIYKDSLRNGSMYKEKAFEAGAELKGLFNAESFKGNNRFQNMYRGDASTFDRVMNHFGSLNEKAVQGTIKLTGAGDKPMLLGIKGKDFARSWVNGSISYTPYMFAKDEFARLWDNEVTDAAIYRTLDGVGAFNPKEIASGARDIWHAIWHQPVSEETYRQSLRQRGLINSRQDIRRLDEDQQRELASNAKSVAAVAEKAKQEQKTEDKPSTVIKTKEQEKEGWAPYEVARASMSDKTVPPGATIH